MLLWFFLVLFPVNLLVGLLAAIFKLVNNVAAFVVGKGLAITDTNSASVAKGKESLLGFHQSALSLGTLCRYV